MNIRNVSLDDAEAIVRIYNKYVLETAVSFEDDALSTEEMRQRIATISASHPYFVGEEDGRLMGYCYVHPWKERTAYRHTMEVTIYLADEAIGHGLGTQLMERLLSSCRQRGYHALVACITADNETSLAFHKRFGFRQASFFPEVGWKLGRWHDVIDLELVLRPEQP